MASHEVIIIGAGFGGLGAAIRLHQLGVDDVLLLEKDKDVGGTWLQNTYPGCACDVSTELYSYSFALNPDWSRKYAPQPEIQAYLKACAQRFGVFEKVKLSAEVARVEWDDAAKRWRVTLKSGESHDARFVISAIGGLSRLALPKVEGLASFTGAQFHSQKWDHGYQLAGKRVAVIGTGASAIQIVPELAKRVGKLLVFQRTPPWIVPRGDGPVPGWQRWLYRNVPGVQRLVRWSQYWFSELKALGFLHPSLGGVGQWLARRHLARQVPAGPLREALTPRYAMGCKRVLISDDYYPAFSQPNVQLVPKAVTRLEGNEVIDASGERHAVDCLVLATGFNVIDPMGPLEVVGRDGRTLKQAWANGLSSNLGTMVSGFPNLFILSGPNTGIGHTSMVFMIECQLRYAMAAIRAARQGQWKTVEVRTESERELNEQIARRSKETVWMKGECRSWYLDEHGRNGVIWPDYTFKFWWRTRRFEPKHHLSS
ncbi:MAG: NAD(P)/FAD-dependent oxidoreductase [Myxococcaceae bacterium]